MKELDFGWWVRGIEHEALGRFGYPNPSRRIGTSFSSEEQFSELWDITHPGRKAEKRREARKFFKNHTRKFFPIGKLAVGSLRGEIERKLWKTGDSFIALLPRFFLYNE